MFEAELRAIWLFFYLIYLDDEKATVVGSKAVDKFYEHMKKNPQTSPSVAVIINTLAVLTKNEGERVSLPENLRTPKDLVYWSRLHIKLNLETIAPLIWSQILKYKIEDIVLATNLTEGTISYRISLGVEVLGEVLSSLKTSMESAQ